MGWTCDGYTAYLTLQIGYYAHVVKHASVA
jgi:hypothetical protein